MVATVGPYAGTAPARSLSTAVPRDRDTVLLG